MALGTRALLLRNLFFSKDDVKTWYFQTREKIDSLYPSKFGGGRVMVDILILAEKFVGICDAVYAVQLWLVYWMYI